MISFKNLTSKEIELDGLIKIGNYILEKENIDAKTDVSVVFIGTGRMRKLNKKYRHKNRVTDVLSFSPKPIFVKNNVLGEIVICLRQVQKNAKNSNSPFKTELGFCLIHGILHLLGYEHSKNIKDANIMKAKENQYLEVFKTIS